MRKNYIIKKFLLLLTGILFSGMVLGDDYPKLMLDFEELEMEVGETYQLPAMLKYVESSESDTVEVSVQWTLEPDSLGTIDVAALFTAVKPGKGHIVATYDTISRSVELEIEMEDDEDDMKEDDFPKLVLPFKKVKLDISETFALPGKADYFENSESDAIEVEVQWTFEPDSLGTLAEFVFTAEKTGEGYLIASYDTISAKAELEVEKDDEDDEDDGDDDASKVKIVPGKVKVELGESVELYAFYIDSVRGKIDTTFMWSVEPAGLGMFPDINDPVFHADNTGKGIITATLGELADTIKVEVYEGKWKDDDDKGQGGKKVTIVPGDTTVLADAGTIQYMAAYKTEGNQDDDGETVWSISNPEIASIDENGLLTLTGTTGLTLVTATIKNHNASVELLVVDPSVDPELNTITVHRVLPSGKVLNPKIFTEGESYKIGGLPYPLNVLNSGKLHFPFGCISENISIFMKIPEEFATTNEDETEVIFSDGIITGVEFNVIPEGADDVVHPYVFHIPLELKLTFKRGLLKSLGIDPHDLDVFFADNAQFVPVGDGVATVDSAANRIYASIEHFSTIVVRKSENISSADGPGSFTDDKFDVYPNPVANTATFRFHLNKEAKVRIEIFNSFGQRIQLLTDMEYTEGTHRIKWSGNDQKGEIASPGIYLCRFIEDGKIKDIEKLVINR